MKYVPQVVAASYLRDYQYEAGYVVICEDYYPQLFNDLWYQYGEEHLSEYPSGNKVFFCKEER